MSRPELKSSKLVIAALLVGLSFWFIVLPFFWLFWRSPEVLSADVARDRLLVHTHGCTDGGQPKGLAASAWPGEFATWFQFTLTDSAFRCLRDKAAAVPCQAGCDPMEEFLTKRLEWFRPVGQAYTFKGKGRRVPD